MFDLYSKTICTVRPAWGCSTASFRKFQLLLLLLLRVRNIYKRKPTVITGITLFRLKLSRGEKYRVILSHPNK
jgi:hypothetical protein